ncbi:Fic family protein [Nocardia caishijiensis]|uniref:Fic family protein n=1 Tax=Nocardia caishijiensis TaxID=184756 RepID=A0ABQ6YJ08_9NOCA|nr:Fic family protein [Nocardia caishijiensis]KAF0845777.1 Fic family protein [Nocardia caishijiensis]
MTGSRYIWEATDWPHLTYDAALLAKPTAAVALAQGRLHGRLAETDEVTQERAGLEALTADVVKSSAIEGELLDAVSVRSSIARRLGVDIGAAAAADRRVDGVVDMVLDATRHYERPVTAQRLFGWHAGLFPTGWSGISRIRVGGWRTDETGPMEVISGPYGKQRVHFEAPPAARVDADMRRFLAWLDADTAEPAILKAGLAHLWFVTIHPFDDGNGRIARALGDLALARSESSPRRFYSLSAQIQRDRKNYYSVLENTQRGGLDVTAWLLWFLDALHQSIAQADNTVDDALAKATFWRRWHDTALNARQITMLNRILDGFDGKLTSRKWAIITKTSQASALRDINELIDHGILRRSASSGRSTAYELA